MGASLQIGYFAQAHEDLNLENTLLQEIESVAPRMLLAEMRDFLARFFSPATMSFAEFPPFRVGARRLALAKLSLTHANLLPLDEPTNHLDIPSRRSRSLCCAITRDDPAGLSRSLPDRCPGTQIWDIGRSKDLACLSRRV
jgi:hypothetical protein